MASSCYENGILGNSDPDVTYLAYTHKTKPAQLLTFHSFIGTLGGAVLTSDLLYLPEFDQPQNIRLFEILNPSAREKGVSFSGDSTPTDANSAAWSNVRTEIRSTCCCGTRNTNRPPT
ncbi:MAG: hypothetical protein ACLR8Y_15680 [Alistipes indistinctus]